MDRRGLEGAWVILQGCSVQPTALEAANGLAPRSLGQANLQALGEAKAHESHWGDSHARQ